MGPVRTLGALFALGILIGLGAACRDESRTPHRETPATASTTTTTTPSTTPGARPSRLDCTTSNATTATAVDLVTFVCAAKAMPPSPGFDLSGLLERLPPRFRKNVTLKHGARRPGVRGHVQETIEDSPSASPYAPRVVMWDETTGFSITYDGTPAADDAPARVKRGAQRLGMLAVDPATSAFSLSVLGSDQPTVPADDCRTCHGPDSRPIWPMYPDWPGFFGSDNDEVTRSTAAQRDELGWLRAVRVQAAANTGSAAGTGSLAGARNRAASTRGRLDALFAPEMDAYLGALFATLELPRIRAYLATVAKPQATTTTATPTSAHQAPTLADAAAGDDSVLRAWLGLELHATYPYRGNIQLALAEPSRALFHRPNSRAGILYNRLQARRLMTRIRATAIYTAQPALVALTIMDCGWPDEPSGSRARVATYEAFVSTAKAELTAREMPAPKPTADRILYPVLLASLGLAVRDVDIRLSHHSAEYARFDRGYVIPSIAKTVMDIGYIAYPNPRTTINGARLFWTSYFDGSASLDELLALAMLDDLAANDPALAALYRPMSLTEKYGAVTARYAIDKPFFDDMDRLGRWLPLPYPEHLQAVHHRDSYKRVRTGPDAATFAFPVQYRAVCEHLRQTLRSR